MFLLINIFIKVREHGTIVITTSYRLGYFGFFNSDNESCNKNVALWDLALTLEWVRDNIEKFNGDKHNVTLFGQSAGGALVDLLTLSPHTNGIVLKLNICLFSKLFLDLFHKVIPMAGNADCAWTINEDVNF